MEAVHNPRSPRPGAQSTLGAALEAIQLQVQFENIDNGFAEQSEKSSLGVSLY